MAEKKNDVQLETEGKVEQDKKVTVLVLKGAATLVSGGKKFVKNVPQQVEDQEMAKRLLASGLFETAGDKR
ncbi:hypothetical protein D2962_08180 [Biomaibacter acetigenes]|uniref:Uncharacterized protein n=1 Tax=Biomaibacter acetigenes TaxID=2316383 RepID=A0A3G2R582_9FIRM|nr:hypothetical protein [Biomaibacter acetigenes]AYO30600.1 hypothetical protein D2962_08180 [Biomaibacter acetigenes]